SRSWASSAGVYARATRWTMTRPSRVGACGARAALQRIDGGRSREAPRERRRLPREPCGLPPSRERTDAVRDALERLASLERLLGPDGAPPEEARRGSYD